MPSPINSRPAGTDDAIPFAHAVDFVAGETVQKVIQTGEMDRDTPAENRAANVESRVGIITCGN